MKGTLKIHLSSGTIVAVTGVAEEELDKIKSLYKRRKERLLEITGHKMILLLCPVEKIELIEFDRDQAEKSLTLEDGQNG